MTRWLAAVVAGAAIAIAACGTPPPVWVPDAGACAAYQVPATTDLMTPATTLKGDVMKVLNANCGTSLCHGSKSAPTGNVFLGASTAMGADSADVFAAIVGVPSDELSSMQLVTAGDPGASYLMHKLDGDQCQFTQTCAGQDCESSMPSGDTTVLPVTVRDTVRRWIAQGAPND